MSLLHGYKMNERGRIIHKVFERDDLLNGYGRKDGWVDSPDKVAGGAKALQAEAAAKAATAHVISPEPARIGPVHGDVVKRGPGRPRKTG